MAQTLDLAKKIACALAWHEYIDAAVADSEFEDKDHACAFVRAIADVIEGKDPEREKATAEFGDMFDVEKSESAGEESTLQASEYITTLGELRRFVESLAALPDSFPVNGRDSVGEIVTAHLFVQADDDMSEEDHELTISAH